MRILLMISRVLSWSYSIHRYLGDSLETWLKKNDNELHFKMLKDLKGVPFSEASIWADKAKRTKEFSWTRRYHYANLNNCSFSVIPREGILDALIDIKKKTGIYSKFTSSERIMFVLHLLQEIGQPLHMSGKFRGGNDFGIVRNKNNRNKTMNLHKLWDSEIPLTIIDDTNYEIPDICDSSSSDLLSIVNVNVNANCEWIFPKTNFIQYEDYYDEKFIKQALDRCMCHSIYYFKDYYNFFNLQDI